MIFLQLIVSLLCLIHIVAILYVAYNCNNEFPKWTLLKVMFYITLFILLLICVFIFISIWTI